MNALEVLFFASLKQQLGCDSISIETESSLTLQDLLRKLSDQFPTEAYQALIAPRIRVAVNQELVQGNPTLNPGDEVAFLPPVTGG